MRTYQHNNGGVGELLGFRIRRVQRKKKLQKKRELTSLVKVIHNSVDTSRKMEEQSRNTYSSPTSSKCSAQEETRVVTWRRSGEKQIPLNLP